MSTSNPRHQLDPTHPEYQEGVQADLSREHRLHQVVAGSAFVLALCLLPLAQYFLLSGSVQGEVAGVSTEQSDTTDTGSTTDTTTTVLGSVDASLEAVPTSGPACEQRKETDLADLQRFAEGKRKALLTEYELRVQPYRVALANLTGSAAAVAADKESLNSTIDSLYQPYLTQLQQTEDAVSVEQTAILERVCVPQE